MSEQVLYRCTEIKAAPVAARFQFVQVSGSGATPEMAEEVGGKFELVLPIERAAEYVVGCHYELVLKPVSP